MRTEAHAPPPPEVDPEVQPPRKQYAPKTSVAARQRVKELRERAKSVSINLTNEDWQEVVDWVLCKRAETGKNLYADAAEFFFCAVGISRLKETPGLHMCANLRIWLSPV